MGSIIEDIINNDPKYSFGVEGKDNNTGGATPPPQGGEPPKEDVIVDPPKPSNVDDGADPNGQPPKDSGNEDPKPSEEDLAKQFMSDFNARLGTQYSNFDDFKSEYSQLDTLRESEKQLKEKLTKASNPFGEDSEVSEIFQFKKDTGRSIDDYYLLKNLDLDDASSIDIMVADAVLNNPKFRGREADVRATFEKKFGLVGDDLDEDEIKTNQMSLDLEIGKYRDNLAELKSKIKPHEFDIPQGEKVDPEVWKTQEKQWDSMIPRISSQMETFKLFDNPEDEQNGKDPVLSLKVPKEMLDDYNGRFREYIAQSKLEPTDENQQHLYQLMVQDYILQNYTTIASEYAAEKLKANNAMWAERTGVDISKLGKTTPPKEDLSDVEKFNKSEQDKVLSKLGIKR